MTPIRTTALSHDRLSFTLFISLMVHALIIFGVTFNPTTLSNAAPSIAVTIATHKAERAPENVDFLAQHNQEASGTETERRELTTDNHADFADNRIQAINSPPEPKQRTQEKEKLEDKQVVKRQNSNRQPIEVSSAINESNDNTVHNRKAASVIDNEIASLLATLDRQRQEYAKRPRKRALTSVSAKSAVDAAYLHQWTQKIEEVGNRNFPRDAVKNNITGSLRLLCVVNADGVVEEMKILQTSGHAVLDTASLQIIRLASPFLPFPPEIRKNTDQLEIIRTWHFDISGLKTTR